MNSQFNSLNDGIYQPASTNNINSNFYKSSDIQSMISNSEYMTNSKAAQSYAIETQQQVAPQNGTSVTQNLSNSNTSFVPETVTNINFWPAYLKQYIGYWMRISSFVGNSFQDYVGKLLDVGAAYVVIKPLSPDVIQIIDMYTIKFVTVILTKDIQKLCDGTSL